MRDEAPLVRVALSPETLARLIGGGQLCAAELRCLDCESKQCVRRLVLEACARNLALGPVEDVDRLAGCPGKYRMVLAT